MVILKRLVVWLLERLIEALLLGVVCGYLWGVKFTGDFWKGAILVAFMLFVSGYYLTTALFGLVWRSQKPWLYPAIAAALLVIHSRIFVFGADPPFTPETRAHWLPFAVVGACIVFGCSFTGTRALQAWLHAGAPQNPYLSATGITLLVFALANIANWMRCCQSVSFRPLGLPFTFYREGGFVGTNWVWQSGRFVLPGLIADALVIATAILLLGKAWQRIQLHRAR